MNQISTNNTNPHLKNDYFGYELEKYGKNSNVLIAVAFFTNLTVAQLVVTCFMKGQN